MKARTQKESCICKVGLGLSFKQQVDKANIPPQRAAALVLSDTKRARVVPILKT
jgi:hypothetical protein